VTAVAVPSQQQQKLKSETEYLLLIDWFSAIQQSQYTTLHDDVITTVSLQQQEQQQLSNRPESKSTSHVTGRYQNRYSQRSILTICVV
jgi:hypothetical protein